VVEPTNKTNTQERDAKKIPLLKRKICPVKIAICDICAVTEEEEKSRKKGKRKKC
jgi:hypothetical protein